MQPGEAGLALVTWQGWGVLSVMAALTALLATILAWLLPFPDRSISRQLSEYEDRVALKERLGAAPPFRVYLLTARRFDEWLMEWFGPAISQQAFERCLAIAFIFPVALLLVTLLANGLTSGHIGGWQTMLFGVAFAIVAYVILVAFRNLLTFIEHAWTSFGGDQELAQTISRVLLGGFAFMVAFSTAFAIASAFSGQVANAGAVLGAMAGGFALAFALAVAFALAGATLFSIVIAVLAGAALAFASEFTFLLFLFFLLLPLTNASIDWLSWASTRFFLRRAERAEPDLIGWAQVAGATLGMFASGALLMIALTALLPNTLETLNFAFTSANLPRFHWEALLHKAVAAPWSDGLFITGMLMTALVPASTHLIIGLTGILVRLTPGASTAAHTISEHPDVPLSPKEQAPIEITLIISRMWYIVAAGFAAAVIAGAGALIYLTQTPVAEFLGNVALCSTSWSHGKCAWF
jgi:hypothetical protein